MNIKSFDNTDDMFAYLDEQAKIARQIADKMNAKEVIPKYDYWAFEEVLYGEHLVIIGQRWKPSAKPAREELEDVKSVEASMANGWIFAKWYSFACPEGELGNNHISKCVPIPEFIFKFCLERIQGK